MILVRDIFQLKFGKAREAMDLWKESVSQMKQMGRLPDRLLTDLTGEYYTLIMETTYNNMAEFETAMHETLGSDEWRQTYRKFADLVNSGRREIFNIIPAGQFGQGQQREEAAAGVSGTKY